jgi:hypothetical protein
MRHCLDCEQVGEDPEDKLSVVHRLINANSAVTKSLSDHPISGAITTTSMASWLGIMRNLQFPWP